MKSICVDFDRVIHQYTTPWSHASVISDPPVEGAFEWLTEMVDHYIVNIFSSRSDHPEGVEAMQEWFKTHGLSPLVLCYLRFPTHKPPAVLYIDDRAYRFEGTFPTVKQIAEFDASVWHPTFRTYTTLRSYADTVQGMAPARRARFDEALRRLSLDVDAQVTSLAEELVTVAAEDAETLISVHSTVKLPDGRQYGLTLERLDATT